MKSSKQRLLELAAIGPNEEASKWARWLRDAKRSHNTTAELRCKTRLNEAEAELWNIEQVLRKTRQEEKA